MTLRSGILDGTILAFAVLCLFILSLVTSVTNTDVLNLSFFSLFPTLFIFLYSLPGSGLDAFRVCHLRAVKFVSASRHEQASKRRGTTVCAARLVGDRFPAFSTPLQTAGIFLFASLKPERASRPITPLTHVRRSTLSAHRVLRRFAAGTAAGCL